jgi:hypothetical protein
MSEETKTPEAQKSEGDSCCHSHCQCACRAMGWVGALILIVIGSLVLAESFAWAGYKKVAASEADITFVTEKGDPVAVQPGQYLKLYRNVNRADVVSVDKTLKTCYYNVRMVTIKKK